MTLRIFKATVQLFIVLLAVGATASAAHPGGCTDIPLRFTLQATATLMNFDATAVTDASGNPITVPSAIVGDGNDVYQTDGSVKVCSGTYDAVLNLLVSKRKISAILPAPIAGSGTGSLTPPPGKYTDNGVLNVRNILCKGCTSPGQPFVTRAGAQLNSMYNGDEYNLRFLPVANLSSLPFAPDLDNDAGELSTANTPNSASLAIVLPQPYNCSAGVYPSWIVRGTLQNQTAQPGFLQVGTLVDLGKSGPGNTAVGQFSMPFEYQIQALTCFTPY